MKKKELIIALSVIGIFVVMIFVGNQIAADRSTEADNGDLSHGTVKILEKTSDKRESSYMIGADLPATDFSSVGKVLSDKIAHEWKIYCGMTEEQQLLSSKLWGHVGIQANTWDECERAIGFAVNNPLESLDWLNKTSYFGMESMDSDIKHIQVNAVAAQTDRKLNEVNITAGYNSGNIRITLRASLYANCGTHTYGSICNGYATYEESTAATGSGVPVLIMTTDETNNNGYYDGNYFDPTAYWVKDNVLYTLRVFGDETNKAEIQATLERILEAI